MRWVLGQLRALVESPVRTLQVFAAGAVFFFAGLGTLYYLDYGGHSGLRSELIALLAIALLGAGFLLSIVAQLIFIWQRLRGD